MFLAEARLAASVSHARIVQVYELGREGDLDFIVMEHVDGVPLSKFLSGKPLPPDRVAELGLQIAQGLARAHREGLVHRDLKPANIMVTRDGDVKIVDFGLAALCARAEPSVSLTSSTVTLSTDGQRRPTVAGTLPYMSPEQVRGEKVDARSDIFSFGSVLYEMTTGQRPFGGKEAEDIAARILRSQPTPVHELVPKVPLELDRIIEKTLARRPADRYQVIDDLAVDFKRLLKELDSGKWPSYEDLKPPLTRRWKRWIPALAGVLILVAAGAGVWMKRTQGPKGKEGGTRAVLVLPLEVIGQTEGGSLVGRAVAEAIAINLAQASAVEVLPVPVPGELPETSGGWRNRAAQELGAGILLTGSLMRDGQSIKATVSAIDTKRNRVICGIQEAADDGDLARVALNAANDLVAGLGLSRPKLYEYFRYCSWTPAMAAFPGLPETVVALRKHDVPAGLAATKRLIEAFPRVYEARAMRLIALVDANNIGLGENEQTAGDELAVIAEIDPKAPIVDLFTAQGLRETDLPRSLEITRRLLARSDLAPSFRSHVLRERMGMLVQADSSDAAFACMEEALRLDPANTFNYHYMAGLLMRSKRFEEAATHTQRAIALDPFYTGHYQRLAIIEDSLGRREEALQALKKACEIGQTQTEWSGYARALERAGRRREAVEAARTAAGSYETAYGSCQLASFWARVGDRVLALQFLRRALALGMAPEYILKQEDCEPLRADPEFRSIVREAEKR